MYKPGGRLTAWVVVCVLGGGIMLIWDREEDGEGNGQLLAC